MRKTEIIKMIQDESRDVLKIVYQVERMVHRTLQLIDAIHDDSTWGVWIGDGDQGALPIYEIPESREKMEERLAHNNWGRGFPKPRLTGNPEQIREGIIRCREEILKVCRDLDICYPYF